MSPLIRQIFYSPGEVDLAQLIKEPFLTSTLDVPATDLSHMITEIPDIDSDSDEEESKEASNKVSKGGSTQKGKEKDTIEASLPSPAPTGGEVDTPPPQDSVEDASPNSPLGRLNQQVEDLVNAGRSALSETPSDDFFDALEVPQPPPKTRSKKAPDPSNRSNFSEDNILPENLTRRRKKPQREEAHVTALQQAVSGEIQAYHTAFAAFIPARLFYEKEFVQTIAAAFVTTPSPNLTRLHRDHLPPEPKYYHHMLKHPHSARFLQAMQVEIVSCHVSVMKTSNS